jgi:two-component system, chemotaxis family, chemotaxis protein CheY
MTKKLLIVDDSATSRQIIRNNVSRFRRDWSIFESDNGFDAIEMCEMIKPDCITMDVNMPNMSGLEAAEKILKVHPAIRIVLITANMQEPVRRRATELGMGFVEKPVTEEAVSRAIKFFEVVNANA